LILNLTSVSSLSWKDFTLISQTMTKPFFGSSYFIIFQKHPSFVIKGSMQPHYVISNVLKSWHLCYALKLKWKFINFYHIIKCNYDRYSHNTDKYRGFHSITLSISLRSEYSFFLRLTKTWSATLTTSYKINIQFFRFFIMQIMTGIRTIPTNIDKSFWIACPAYKEFLLVSDFQSMIIINCALVLTKALAFKDTLTDIFKSFSQI